MIKPFNKYYVLRITSLHIKKAIDTSIRKTYDRLKDVPSKNEVFETLDVLHKIRKLMEDFESNNKHLYQKPEDNKKDENENDNYKDKETAKEKEMVNNKNRVLIHCQAGISRSSTVTIAYLIKTRNMKYCDAEDYVRSKREMICPNSGFQRILQQFESELRDKKNQSNPKFDCEATAFKINCKLLTSRT